MGGWIKFDINYLKTGSILETFNESNKTRNLVSSYLQYSVLVNGDEFPLIGFTGSTTLVNDYIYIRTSGNPFENIVSGKTLENYHIKPNKIQEGLFFDNLSDFGSNLLNRFITPKYTSTYRVPSVSDDGVIIISKKTLTWPTTDGYNIDFDSTTYIQYVEDLITIAKDFDGSKTNLMVRFFTAESISDFDSAPTCDGGEYETAGQRIRH